VNIKHRIELAPEEREYLQTITAKGSTGARTIKRTNILLMADQRKHTDQAIADALSAGTATVYRTKRNFVEYGLESALAEGGQPRGTRLLNWVDEAKVVALACSKPPQGCARWTLSLLGDRLVALTDLEAVSIETIRRRLKENALKPWQKKMCACRHSMQTSSRKRSLCWTCMPSPLMRNDRWSTSTKP
jgi:hypothetical protein